MGKWAQETFAKLTLAEKVGQTVCYRASRWRAETVQLAREGLVGAVSPGYYAGMQQLGSIVEYMNELLAASPVPPLFISSNACARPEFGATPFPTENSAMILGAARDPALARQCARLSALESKTMGYSMVWEPSVDVNTQPRNPIIGTRSFSEDPKLVAEMGAAVVEGMQESRVLPNAKHFPGHGDTDFDTHVKIGVVPHDRARLDAVELYPYRALVKTGLRGVMTAHIAFPALDPDTSRPATFSRRAIHDVLRGEMGFQGLIVSDSLTMKAIKDNFSADEAVILAFNAGHDIILQDYNEPPALTLEALLDAVRDGRIPMAELDASVMRILEAKEWCGLADTKPIDLARIRNVFQCDEHMAVMRRVYESGVTLLEAEALPLPTGGRACLIGTLAPEEGTALTDMEHTVENSRNVFFRECASRLSESTTHVLPEDPTEAEVSAALAAADGCDVVLFATMPRIVCYKEMSGTVGRGQVVLAEHLLAAGKTVVLCVFGNPYILADFPRMPVCLTTFSSQNPAVAAGVRVLFGEIPARGRLPVTISGRYAFGYGLGGV